LEIDIKPQKAQCNPSSEKIALPNCFAVAVCNTGFIAASVSQEWVAATKCKQD
jgi:hypothetical protein